jgi:glutamate--cysteine ligase
MTDFRGSGRVVPIESVDQLVTQFREASKPRERWMIGTEWEKLAVDPRTGHAVRFDGARGIEAVLNALADGFGWERKTEGEQTVALARDGASITLEPGGQVELSGRQCPSIHCTEKELAGHVRELLTVGRDLGIVFLGLGAQPVSTLDDIGWVPKQRYRIMREYMPRVGTLGHFMMKSTATVQANIDYADEADAMAKLRVGMGTAPLLAAMFANSPFQGSRLSDRLSFRSHVWSDVDPARCGVLPFLLREDASFADYVEWALDVPLYFVLRDGRYVTEATGMPFRRFLEGGLAGERATLDDWNLHLTTLFPEVRLKGYIEFRACDSQSPTMVLAIPALVKGLCYDADALRAAWDLVRDWRLDERLALQEDVTRRALDAEIRGIPVLDLARELVAIALEGLRRQARVDDFGRDESQYLAPLEALLAEGLCPAAALARQWNGPWAQRVERLVAHTAVQPPA